MWAAPGFRGRLRGAHRVFLTSLQPIGTRIAAGGTKKYGYPKYRALVQRLKM